jgi:hypothetical protein
MEMDKPNAIQLLAVIAETIRELGAVPSGHLYANVMSYMSLDIYNLIISTLKKAGLVEEKAHLLTWIGPTLNKG